MDFISFIIPSLFGSITVAYLCTRRTRNSAEATKLIKKQARRAQLFRKAVHTIFCRREAKH